MAVATVLTPGDQKRRRRRARISQREIAERLDISEGALSEYENGKKDLPFALTPEDYEAALVAAIKAKSK
jgi:transcriptional regulator with XRE-family HTH domain